MKDRTTNKKALRPKLLNVLQEQDEKERDSKAKSQVQNPILKVLGTLRIKQVFVADCKS